MRRGTLLLPTILLVAASGSAAAQEDTEWWAGELPGAALGAFSGAFTGSLGSILPCTQTTLGRRCVNAATALGAGIGLTAGTVVGHRTPNRLDELGRSAAIGFAAGTLAGFAGRPFAQRFGLVDVLAVGLAGAAVGTQPRPALVGFSVGAVAGAVLWWRVPGFELSDAVAGALAGVLVGVWSGWIIDAADAPAGTGLSPTSTFSLRIPIGR